MTKTTPLLLGMLALTACPGDETPIDTEGGTSTGDDTTGTTVQPPVTTIEPDSGSGSGEVTSGSSSGSTGEPDPCDGVECPEGEECVAGSCFTCGMPTCEEECAEGQTCQCPEDDICCDVGTCSAPVCPLPLIPGNYADCLDDMGMTSDAPCDGAGCVVDNEGAPTAAVCVATGCEATCQCPPAPAGSDAPVTCEDVTADDVGDCWLDCGAGDCPDGMVCFGGFICLFSNEEPVDVPLYGDCVNVPGATCQDGFCVTAPDGGVCTAPCADETECQPAPATGDAVITCGDVTGDMMAECTLSCEGGETCPDGMECFGGFVCIWPEMGPPPPPTAGYNPCVIPGTDCPAGEVCLDDAMGMADPTWEVCAQEGCATAADCTLVPPGTGNAPVACGDADGGGGANTCYLDCSAGQTCPDGMACENGTLCAWPQGAALFEDDFEGGDLAAVGWTLADVDGLVPNAMVSFVDAAWVIADDGAGNNIVMSTSWYMPAGVSDDWLISPAIMLGADGWLFWASSAADPAFPDNLEVYVSTTGNTPADFTDPPVFTATPEAATFTAHGVDLAAAGYANAQVYIAFRNTTNDGFLLLLDNVTVANLP